MCVQTVVNTPDICDVNNTRGPYAYQSYRCFACVEEQVRDGIFGLLSQCLGLNGSL